MLRALFVSLMIGVLALLVAAPAYAHGHRHATHAAKVAPAPAKLVTKFAQRSFPCSVPTVVAREFAHPYHSHAPGHAHHDDADHDPSDHSHPPGEDFVFHVMLHCGLDFAPFAEIAPALSQARDRGVVARPPDARSGITVLPPVPPPLA